MYILDGNIDWQIVLVCVCAILFFAIVGYYTDKIKMDKDKERLKKMSEESLDSTDDNESQEQPETNLQEDIKTDDVKTDDFPFEDISKKVEETSKEPEKRIFDIEESDSALGILDDVLVSEGMIDPIPQEEKDAMTKVEEPVHLKEDNISLNNIRTPQLLQMENDLRRHLENYVRNEKAKKEVDELDLGKPPILKTEQEEDKHLAVDDIFKL